MSDTVGRLKKWLSEAIDEIERLRSAMDWPVAWVCDDERYPFVIGIVTTSSETVAAWVESGIKFTPLIRRTALSDLTKNRKSKTC